MKTEIEWFSPAEKLPEPVNDTDEDHVFCMIVIDGRVLHRPWNFHYKCWDDEEGDDFAYDAMDPEWWAYAPTPPVNIITHLQEVLGDDFTVTDMSGPGKPAGEHIWECKIGGKTGSLPPGADHPMRQAVEQAFLNVTGFEATFNFSGWGAELTETERMVLDDE